MKTLISVFITLIMGSAAMADCGPDKLGTSRTLQIDEPGDLRVGTMQYPTTLELDRQELVLTFDDGPNPETTPRVLDILDEHCVKATFYILGRAAEAHPELVHEIHNRGHSIANHSYSHPDMRVVSHDQAIRDIERGRDVSSRVLAGAEGTLAPFFRFPFLRHTPELHAYFGTQDIAVISCDIDTLDWQDVSADELFEHAMNEVRKIDRGVVLMHDIHQRTVDALPRLLDTLADQDYRIVHMVGARKE